MIDAAFVWTEEHSRRLKVKLTVQKEVSLCDQTMGVVLRVLDLSQSCLRFYLIGYQLFHITSFHKFSTLTLGGGVSHKLPFYLTPPGFQRSHPPTSLCGRVHCDEDDLPGLHTCEQ